MEESTSIPIPMANPPNDIMLRETSNMFKGANVTRIEIGILKAMIAVVRRSRRNNNKTMMASIPPM